MNRPSSGLSFLSLLGLAWASALAQDAEKVVFTEPFADKLDKGWSWVREDAKAWRIDKGMLVIKTSTGSLWQGQNNNRNILVRPLPQTKRARRRRGPGRE